MAINRTLYALLVGIDDYDGLSSVPAAAAVPAALKGCLNDVEGIKTYLTSRVDQNQFALRLRVLTGKQATRQNIINSFRQHLAKAGADDVVLFYFAGHGRQLRAPQPFWPVARNRLLRTLVCYDSGIDNSPGSRQQGIAPDLAQIELEQLIAEVGQKNPQITVVLDCGYVSPSAASASGLRAQSEFVGTRGLPLDPRPRPLESFIVSPQAAQARLDQLGMSSFALSAQPSSSAVRSPVIFSACGETQAAVEYAAVERAATEPENAQLRRGAFSDCLQTSLAKSNGGLSNLALFKRTNACLLSRLPMQSAQLRAAKPALEQPFLAGAIAPVAPYYTVSHHPEDGWIVDGGTVHGLCGKSTKLALFPYYTPAGQMAQVAEAIAHAPLTDIYPRFSKIDSIGLAAAKATDIFRAVVIQTAVPPLPVLLEGDAAGAHLLRQSLNSAGPNRAPSAVVQVAGAGRGGASAALRVRASHGAYAIYPPVGDRPLTSRVHGYTESSAIALVRSLEHIARWKTIVELDSPANSEIQGLVKLKIYTGAEPNPEDATEITDDQLRLSYVPQSESSAESSPGSSSQSWVPARFRIKLHNLSNQALYCALFYLNDRFRAASIKIDSEHSVVRLLPGQEMWFAEGTALNGTVPDSLWQQGITECQESLKLIACLHEFDPTLLNLSELSTELTHQPDSHSNQPLPQSESGSLNQLLYQVHHRYTTTHATDGTPASPRTQPITTYDDWRANQLTFTFVRPQLPMPLSNAANGRVVISGSASLPTAQTGQANASPAVKVLAHKTLSADAHLATQAQAVQTLASVAASPEALPMPNAEPFLLTPGQASDAGLSVLVLSNVQRPETITPEHPLYIETDVPLQAGKQIVPVAFDGQTYIPVGRGRLQNGQTQIVINRLPKLAIQQAGNLKAAPDKTRPPAVGINQPDHCDKTTLCIFLQQLDYVTETLPTPTPAVPAAAQRRMPNASISPKASQQAGRQMGHPPSIGKGAAAIGAVGAVAASAATKAKVSPTPPQPPVQETVPPPVQNTPISNSNTPNTKRAIPAMQTPDSANQPTNQPGEQPLNTPIHPITRRPLNQPAVNQPTVNQPAVNQPTVNQPTVNQPVVNQPVVNQPLNQPTVNQPAARPANQPLNQAAYSQPAPISQPVVQQPYQEPELDDVYAPVADRRPRSEVSPIMWAWVLGTGLLALIVAIAWIQYFQTWFVPAPEVVAPASPAQVLPVEPEGLDTDDLDPSNLDTEEPPIAPE